MSRSPPRVFHQPSVYLNAGVYFLGETTPIKEPFFGRLGNLQGSRAPLKCSSLVDHQNPEIALRGALESQDARSMFPRGSHTPPFAI
jgi:hypothetical protein